MEGIKGKVIILEDDVTLSSSLAAAFKKEGYEAFVTSNTEEATDYLNAHSVSAIFVDCLLPSTSGVDYVQAIRKKFSSQVLDVVLMSGLFTDSQFVKESLRQTQAIAFLKKPFDLKEALAFVKPNPTHALVEEIPPRKALYLLMGRSKVSQREKRKAIEALESIHGFDLPYIYSLLVETKASGHLNIVKENGEVSGVSLSQGKIIGVDIIDKETQLGQLLIEAGYLMRDDLTAALNINNQKRIGEKLIQANLLSPHAFNIALENQMKIRISRTIVDTSVRINFVTTDIDLTEPYLDGNSLTQYMHDWIASKLTNQWLKAHYMQWENNQISLVSQLSSDSEIWNYPLIEKCKSLVESVKESSTLQQLTANADFDQEVGFKALHFLFIKGYLQFGEIRSVANEDVRFASLQKMLLQLQGKNKLEVLDVLTRLTGGSDSDIDFVYNEFMRMLGPQPTESQNKIAATYHKLASLAKESYEFSKTGNREKMKEQLARSEIEFKLKAASHFEEAKQLLLKTQYAQALTLLQKAVKVDPSLEKIKLYMAWAHLALLDSTPQKKQALAEIETQLIQIPPEEKFDALYSFVLGLVHKSKGDFSLAKKAFEKVINLDSNFIMARRELASISGQTQVKKDVLNRDLKDLIGGFFKKKSS